MNIWRYEAGKPMAEVADEVALEEPLEIRVKNRAVSVTMRTPGRDEELAVGFLLTEGIITRREQIARIEPCVQDRGGNVQNVILTEKTAIDFERLTRHVFASSSCGLCGKATIDAVHQTIEPIETKLAVRADVLLSLPDKLRAAQKDFDRTGGLHAAGIFSVEGEPLVIREDVGRHNAVDKCLGFALLNRRLPLDQHILMVSGRASFEIMQKSLAGRIAVVAAVSAPSSLAVDFARDSGQTLVGFVRGMRMNVYSGRDCIG
jgi:FdhD protein